MATNTIRDIKQRTMILTDPLQSTSESEMTESHPTVEDPSAASPVFKIKHPAHPVNSVLNMVNAVIGAGVLGLPFAFAKAGILPAILIFAVMVVISYLSLTYVAYTADALLVYSYGDVCHFLT